MRLDREVRRTAAQFLNGLAVAVTATLLLTPAAGGATQGPLMVAAVVGAALLHVVALAISSGG